MCTYVFIHIYTHVCGSYVNIYIYIIIYTHIGGWGGESFVTPTGKSFRFVRACERARRGEAAWVSESLDDSLQYVGRGEASSDPLRRETAETGWVCPGVAPGAFVLKSLCLAVYSTELAARLSRPVVPVVPGACRKMMMMLSRLSRAFVAL